MWDEALADGVLPDPYERFPTDEDAPTVEDACPPDEHTLDIDPAKRPPDNPLCAACHLAEAVPIEIAGQPQNILSQRYPAICAGCETTLEPGTDRAVRADKFLCPACNRDEWEA